MTRCVTQIGSVKVMGGLITALALQSVGGHSVAKPPSWLQVGESSEGVRGHPADRYLHFKDAVGSPRPRCQPAVALKGSRYALSASMGYPRIVPVSLHVSDFLLGVEPLVAALYRSGPDPQAWTVPSQLHRLNFCNSLCCV
jgi:hypothetical protein